jgi:hypothetical protein
MPLFWAIYRLLVLLRVGRILAVACYVTAPPPEVAGVPRSGPEPSGVTVRDVFASLARHPYDAVIRRWNWKMAAVSAVTRGLLFLFVNLAAGPQAALKAAALEFVLRGCTSGFYAAITQAFRRAEPAWAGTLTAMVLLPALVHSVELLVHWIGGTPFLGRSIGASVALTAFTTQLYLFVARRNVLIVGGGHYTLKEDVRRLPGVIMEYVSFLPRLARRSFVRSS